MDVKHFDETPLLSFQYSRGQAGRLLEYETSGNEVGGNVDIDDAFSGQNLNPGVTFMSDFKGSRGLTPSSRVA